MKITKVKSRRVKAIASALLIALTLPTLTACIPAMVAGATVTGINIATDRRTLGRNIDDNTLELNLRKDYQFDRQLTGSNVSVTVFNGIILLTGEVATDRQRRYAAQVATRRGEEMGKVVVVNELVLAGATSAVSRVNDSYITGKVKTKLLRSPRVPSNAIKVITEAGKVYLLGVVSTSEADAAVAVTRTVGGITHIVKVFSYTDR